MTCCPECQGPVLEIPEHGPPEVWRCRGSTAVIVWAPVAGENPRFVTYRVESLEADQLIRGSGCTPPL